MAAQVMERPTRRNSADTLSSLLLYAAQLHSAGAIDNHEKGVLKVNKSIN